MKDGVVIFSHFFQQWFKFTFSIYLKCNLVDGWCCFFMSVCFDFFESNLGRLDFGKRFSIELVLLPRLMLHLGYCVYPLHL